MYFSLSLTQICKTEIPLPGKNLTFYILIWKRPEDEWKVETCSLDLTNKCQLTVVETLYPTQNVVPTPQRHAQHKVWNRVKAGAQLVSTRMYSEYIRGCEGCGQRKPRKKDKIYGKFLVKCVQKIWESKTISTLKMTVSCSLEKSL
jgi:hypothetical protein